MLEHGLDFFRGRLHLDALQALLEVVVAHVSITVFVKLAEHLEQLHLTVKDLVLDLVDELADAWIMQLLLRHFLRVDVALEELGRRVGSRLGRKLSLDIIVVSEHQLGNTMNVSGAVLVIVERRQEAFNIFLHQSAVHEIVLAMRQHKLLQLIDGDVAVGVRHDLLRQLLVELLLALSELDLQLAVHLDEALFNVLDDVLGHLLLVEHNVVVIEDVGGFRVSGQLGWRAQGSHRLCARRWRQLLARLQILQAHLELVFLREEEVGVLLDGQLDIAHFSFVHFGALDEHLGLVEADTDADLVGLSEQIVRVNVSLGTAIILVEDRVNIVARRIFPAERTSSVSDSRQVDLVFERVRIALLDLLGREQSLRYVFVVNRAASTLGLRLGRHVVVSLSGKKGLVRRRLDSVTSEDPVGPAHILQATLLASRHALRKEWLGL